MRLTRSNPIFGVNNKTYRIPYATEELFREQSFLGERAILGKVADLLGTYEDLGTVEELTNMKCELSRLKGGN